MFLNFSLLQSILLFFLRIYINDILFIKLPRCENAIYQAYKNDENGKRTYIIELHINGYSEKYEFENFFIFY